MGAPRAEPPGGAVKRYAGPFYNWEGPAKSRFFGLGSETTPVKPNCPGITIAVKSGVLAKYDSFLLFR